MFYFAFALIKNVHPYNLVLRDTLLPYSLHTALLPIVNRHKQLATTLTKIIKHNIHCFKTRIKSFCLNSNQSVSKRYLVLVHRLTIINRIDLYNIRFICMFNIFRSTKYRQGILYKKKILNNVLTAKYWA